MFNSKTKKASKPAPAPKSRGRKKKKGKSSEEPFWVSEVNALPREGLFDVEQSRKRAVKRFRAVRSLPWVAGVLACLVFVLLINTNTGPQAPTNSYASVSRALAISQVDSWLKTDPAPLPGGHVLGWESSEIIEPQVDDSNPDKEPPPSLEAHKVAVADESGQVFIAEVSIVLPYNAAPAVAGPPLLVSADNIDKQASGYFSWPGWKSTPVEDDAKVAIENWANAYLGSEPGSLRAAVGDPDKSRLYMPLGGAYLVSINANQGAVRLADLDGNKVPPRLIVSVSLKYSWSDPGPKEKIRSSNVESVPMQMDLLIDGADTASPKVVAWGPAGFGPRLVPYMNAVSGRKSVSAPSVSASPTPTPSVGAEAEEGEK
ncbi:hypothetical protein QP568_09990 [Propionimicrobium lymphophilum]|uniref:hypothetical protein n=1 Tax=Propionimicrobium lymphophilum TaxID=33012 RepID=UPI00254D38ED|nr:hypothetical protein [Propionimicrobium lymphophilum]MDK7710824.1 hypothetical protein [Propionimicrobium lymphophilum]MDK7734613.1 hypothetical protein [Propionimicrobium lymphophilum]